MPGTGRNDGTGSRTGIKRGAMEQGAGQQERIKQEEEHEIIREESREEVPHWTP